MTDALAQGARLLTGDAQHALGSNFYQPTIIALATAEMRVCREETFGSVAPRLRFVTEAGAAAGQCQGGLP